MRDKRAEEMYRQALGIGSSRLAIMNAPCWYLMTTSLGEEYGLDFESFSERFHLLAISVFVFGEREHCSRKQRHPIVIMEARIKQQCS
jgi:hypothetical protein